MLIVYNSLALFHSLPLTPADICGDRFAFGLRERTEHCYEYLTVNLKGIHILLLEDDRYTKLFQRTYIIQAIDRVSSKARDGFCKHDIYFALLTLANHTQELRALAGRSTGYAFVGEDTRHSPLFISHNLICVVILLRLITGELFFVIGRYAAVSRHPELTL